MSITLRYELLAISLLLIIFIFYIVRKKKVSLKYSLVWLFAGGIIFLAAAFPNISQSISKLLGFEVLSNMIFLMLIGLLTLILLSLTVIVSKQKEQINTLTQELSVLKSQIEKLKSK